MGYPDSDLREVLEVNTFGIKRVVEAVVRSWSQRWSYREYHICGGSQFCRGMQRRCAATLINRNITWKRLESFLEQCLEASGDSAAFQKMGMGMGRRTDSPKPPNAYTLVLVTIAELISTHRDLSNRTYRPLHYSKTPAEMRMKTPAEGTVSTMHLLFGDVRQSGHYLEVTG